MVNNSIAVRQEENGLAPVVPQLLPILRKTPMEGGPRLIQVAGRVFTASYFWSTGTCLFVGTQERYIVYYPINGPAGFYKPRRHIVLSSNPRVGTLIRAEKKVKGLMSNFSRRISSSRKRRR